jgi:phytoene dehydrogenase-like protein
MDQPQIIIVGGGLAGLTAAASLTRAGQRVLLLEAGEQLGGRARSRRRDGYDLNLGPHALYRAGGGLAVLRRLGVRVSGRLPRLDRAGVLVDGRVVPAFAHLRTAVRDRVRVARALTGLGEKAATGWAGRPAQAWVDSVTDDPAGRSLLASIVRTATYSGDLSLLDAGAATAQLRAAAHGVLYIHHGWSSLVEGLADVIRTGGGEIRTRSAVAAVEHDDAVRAVRLAEGQTLDADAVVVALPGPRQVAGLLEGDARSGVGALADAVVPVRMAHLDVAFRPLPAPRFPNVFGLDEPVYVTVPSSVADVAPDGGAVVHVARYLRPSEADTNHRASLEAVLDVAQPDWQDHVVDARYVPRSMVCGDHARPSTRGLADRPSVDVAGVRGLALAGDWVGTQGMLADASIHSGVAAARAVIASELRTSGRARA